MDMLHSVLIYDLFGLIKPGRSVSQDPNIFSIQSELKAKLTAEVAYASTHWVYHAIKSLHYTTVQQATRAFISKSLLNWVELMGWRSQITQCVSALSDLNKSAMGKQDKTDTSHVSFAF